MKKWLTGEDLIATKKSSLRDEPKKPTDISMVPTGSVRLQQGAVVGEKKKD